MARDHQRALLRRAEQDWQTRQLVGAHGRAANRRPSGLPRIHAILSGIAAVVGSLARQGERAGA